MKGEKGDRLLFTMTFLLFLSSSSFLLPIQIPCIPSSAILYPPNGACRFTLIQRRSSSISPNGLFTYIVHSSGKVIPKSEELKLIQAAFRGDVVMKVSPDAHKVSKSKEYGASYAVLQLAKQLELDRAIYSRPQSNGLKIVLL